MELIFEKKKYISYHVYSVTKIKNKYGFRILLTFLDNSTRTIQKSGFKTKKEANENRDQAVTELHNGDFVIDDKIYVSDFFSAWLEKIMKPNITSDSYDAYKNVVYNHIIPKLGKVLLINLNAGHITKFYNQIAEYSKSVAKLCKVVFNTALDCAKTNNLVQINVAKGINLPKNIKNGKYRVRSIDTANVLTQEQLQLLVVESKNTPIYLQVLFAGLMGLRKSEINGLKYSDIDYIHRKLKINRQLGKKANTDNSELKIGEYTKQDIEPKTYSSKRELDIPDIVFEAILEERKKYEKNRSRRINDKTTTFKDYNYIVCSTYGNPRSKAFHFKYWKKLLKDLNLPDISFHHLRSTYCTLLVNNNFNLKAISQLMGHATEIISVDVYTDKQQIIEDCLYALEPFIDDVRPIEEVKKLDNDFYKTMLEYQILETTVNGLITV